MINLAKLKQFSAALHELLTVDRISQRDDKGEVAVDAGDHHVLLNFTALCKTHTPKQIAAIAAHDLRRSIREANSTAQALNKFWGDLHDTVRPTPTEKTLDNAMRTVG